VNKKIIMLHKKRRQNK